MVKSLFSQEKKKKPTKKPTTKKTNKTRTPKQQN